MSILVFRALKEALGLRQATYGHVVRFCCPEGKAVELVTKLNQVAEEKGQPANFFRIAHGNGAGKGFAILEVSSTSLSPDNVNVVLLKALGAECRTILGLLAQTFPDAELSGLAIEKLSTYHQIKKALGNRAANISGFVMRFAYDSDQVQEVSKTLNKLARHHGYRHFAEYEIDQSKGHEPRGILKLDKQLLETPAKTSLDEFIKLMGLAEKAALQKLTDHEKDILNHRGTPIFGINTTQHEPTGFAKLVLAQEKESAAKLKAAGFYNDGTTAPDAGYKRHFARLQQDSTNKLKAAGFAHLVTAAR